MGSQTLTTLTCALQIEYYRISQLKPTQPKQSKFKQKVYGYTKYLPRPTADRNSYHFPQRLLTTMNNDSVCDTSIPILQRISKHTVCGRISVLRIDLRFDKRSTDQKNLTPVVSCLITFSRDGYLYFKVSVINNIVGSTKEGNKVLAPIKLYYSHSGFIYSCLRAFRPVPALAAESNARRC